MKIIKSSTEIIPQGVGVTGIYKMIELAGRTAYKSEDKITEGSAAQFVSKLQNLNHGAALEHGTVYLFDSYDSYATGVDIGQKYLDNPYSVVKVCDGKDLSGVYITTNYRVLVENGWLSDLKYRCEPTEYHEKRITAKFILSRGIANEFVRHRGFSFLQESTRYCNYSKYKFSGVTFIASSECPLNIGEYKMSDTSELVGDGFIADPFDNNLDAAQVLALTYFETEASYLELINRGVKPQIARDVLPLGLKTELIMTGTESQWDNFFKLRCAPNAHPDARKLAIELRNLMDIH